MQNLHKLLDHLGNDKNNVFVFNEINKGNNTLSVVGGNQSNTLASTSDQHWRYALTGIYQGEIGVVGDVGQYINSFSKKWC